MRNLFAFLLKNNFLILFVILEIISIILLGIEKEIPENVRVSLCVCRHALFPTLKDLHQQNLTAKKEQARSLSQSSTPALLSVSFPPIDLQRCLGKQQPHQCRSNYRMSLSHMNQKGMQIGCVFPECSTVEEILWSCQLL